MTEPASRRPWLTYVALVLWVPTALVIAKGFVWGQTAPSTDQRIAVKLSPAERDLVLGEMRSLVAGLHGVVDGLAKDDRGQIANSLSDMGMKMAADDRQSLLMKLPLDLKRNGMGLHRKMDTLAAGVRDHTLSNQQLLHELSSSLATCVSCHATYKLVADGRGVPN